MATVGKASRAPSPPAQGFAPRPLAVALRLTAAFLLFRFSNTEEGGQDRFRAAYYPLSTGWLFSRSFVRGYLVKTKLLIAAAVLGAFSNVAFAADDFITLRGVSGYKNFVELEIQGLNPRIKHLDLIVVSKKSCEEMVAFFDAEKDGISESLGGHFSVMNTQPGKKIRHTMMTDLKPGGTLTLKKVICYNNNKRSMESLDDQKGYRPSSGGFGPATTAPSLRDLPFFKGQF